MEPELFTADPTARDIVLSARAASLAHRLLSGPGKASILAYNLCPTAETDVLCHGLSDDGDLIVAVVRDVDDMFTVTPSTEPTNVRFDVVKEAPEWTTRITACSLHLLGAFEWLTPDAVDGYVARKALHPRMAEIARAPEVRLGMIRAGKVLLHDSSGVTALAFADIARHHVDPAPNCAAFPSDDQEWDARELVGQLPQAALIRMFDATAAGWQAGMTLSIREAHTCPQLQGRVLCVDIDRTGLTLMLVLPGLTETALFAFTQPAETVEELGHRLAELLELSSIPTRTPRI